jgi:hypothetical protein
MTPSISKITARDLGSAIFFFIAIPVLVTEVFLENIDFLMIDLYPPGLKMFHEILMPVRPFGKGKGTETEKVDFSLSLRYKS